MRKSRKIIDMADIVAIVEELKKQGKKVVLTTGTFDLLHEGHVEYLYQGKDLGDVLIVGLDTDTRTKIDKGPDRPIIKEAERAFLVAVCECVDYVVLNDLQNKEEDKNLLAKTIRPDILLISHSTKKREQRNDFEANMSRLLEGYCAKVVCLPPQAETSTSNQIRMLATTGKLTLIAGLSKFFSDHGYELKPIETSNQKNSEHEKE